MVEQKVDSCHSGEHGDGKFLDYPKEFTLRSK